MRIQYIIAIQEGANRKEVHHLTVHRYKGNAFEQVLILTSAYLDWLLDSLSEGPEGSYLLIWLNRIRLKHQFILTMVQSNSVKRRLFVGYFVALMKISTQ